MRVVFVEEHQLFVRRHEVAHGQAVQGQYAFHHHRLAVVEHASLHPFLNHDGDLLLSHGWVVRLLQPDETQYQFRRGSQEPHQRTGQPGQPVHRASHQPGDALGIIQSDALGHELAEDQGEEGDPQHHRSDADRLAISGQPRK